MQQNKVVKNILYIAILTTVVVATWIFSNVWHSLVTPTIAEDTSQYSTPITPMFDTQTLEQLGSRILVPVDFSQKGDYITDPRGQRTGTPSAEITDPPEPDIQQPDQEDEVEESPDQVNDILLPPTNNPAVSPTPEQTL